MSEAAPTAPAASAEGSSEATETPQVISTSTLPKAVKPTAKGVKATPKPNMPPAEASGGHVDGETAEVEPEAKAPELFEVTINGKKVQRTREQLIAIAQKEEASQQRFKEASELTKKSQRTMAMLKENPVAILEELGIDLDALATQRLSAKAEEALLTPDQRELKAAKAEVEKYKSQEAKAKAAAEQAEQQKHYDAVGEHLEKGFIEAAKKIGMETDPDALERMAAKAIEAVELKIPMTLEQIAAEVHEGRESLRDRRDAKIAAGKKGEDLLNYLGAATVAEVHRASLAKLKGAPAYEKKTAPPPEPKESQNKHVSVAEYRKSVGL